MPTDPQAVLLRRYVRVVEAVLTPDVDAALPCSACFLARGLPVLGLVVCQEVGCPFLALFYQRVYPRKRRTVLRQCVLAVVARRVVSVGHVTPATCVYVCECRQGTRVRESIGHSVGIRQCT